MQYLEHWKSYFAALRFKRVGETEFNKVLFNRKLKWGERRDVKVFKSYYELVTLETAHQRK